MKDQPFDTERSSARASDDFDTILGSCLYLQENFDLRHPDSIKSILAVVVDILQVRVALFGHFDHQGKTFHLREQIRSRSESQPVHLTDAHGFFDPVVAEKGGVSVCRDLRENGLSISMPDAQRNGLCSYLGCPVIIDGNVIGSLSIFDSGPRVFGSLDILAVRMSAMLIACVESCRQCQASFEDRLKESEALTYQMLQLSPVAIYSIDLLEQRFLSVNEQMCRSTGYTEEELLAMKPLDLLTPQSRMFFVQRCEAMAVGELVSTEIELELKTKKGDVEWGQFHIRHIYTDNKISGANVVAHFITEQKREREELARYRKQLEALVQARTVELARTNAQLREEIERRAEATRKLRNSSDSLQEMNTAMRVLLDKRNEDQERAEEVIRMSLKELIDPYLERLENSGLRGSQKQLLDVIRMNLDEVVGSAMPELSSKYYMLTPNEVQVVNLVRKGKTTKEMSRLLNLSVRTIEAYRNSIRKKFNLKNKKINLRTYLSSI